ncbi:thiamine pyrophosphate-binding protein [Microtetraspora malaysiensis]|uniref:thiamine pyrophosphate-binding protein n=1 Tax=Microtetraspora malaysiensis TaxID=161358 RepID=UPI0008302B2E|nr:thiamine pyrophosphate-binding protein [Microtetraspora malaysiensis]
MTPRNGADAIYDALRALDVDRVFVVASVHNLPILEAIRRHGGIDVVNMRHEQSVVHAADGYARASGRLGVGITSTGPGAANSVGGLFEAYSASSPVLILTGQVETRFYGQGRGYLHEAERQLPMLRSVTKEAWSVSRVATLGATVVNAGVEALSGRPGPTAVEIPINLQYAPTEEIVAPPVPVPPLSPPEDRIARAAELLASARRPVIWAGGGVVRGEAWAQLRALAEALDIPVVTTRQGRGALPENHPLSLGVFMGQAPLREGLERSDLVLAVGTRFRMTDTCSWQLALPPTLIQIDVEPTAFGRSYPVSVALAGDAATTLRALRDRVTGTQAETGWNTRLTAAAEAGRTQSREVIGPDHQALVRIIRELLPESGAVVCDVTVPAYNWGDRLLPALEPRTTMHPVSTAIGPGLPLSIGATLARAERSVVIHGDGGIMLTIGELVVAAQRGIPLTVLVFNDRGYGVLRRIQTSTFPEAPFDDLDLHTPDFVGLAQSVGVQAGRVSSVAEFEAAFAKSVASDGPYLIDVDLEALAPIRGETKPEQMIG